VYNATQVSITVEIVNKYRIMAVLKVETDINTSTLYLSESKILITKFYLDFYYDRETKLK
jgi:hypothetical protein